MSEKTDLIQKMMEMQKAFTKYEQENGVTQEEYYTADGEHPLAGYRQKYAEMATKVLELAHAEQGSHA